jgi:TP901 family phage tail tape measure protein
MATSKEKLQIIVDAQGIAKTKAQLKGMEKATGASTKSFGAMAAGIAGATVALYAMGKATSFAIRVGKEFEQGMANVKAISGATGQEFKALEANARKLGASTKFTATEVAGLQTEFSKLGFTATEINKVTAGTLALAAATGSDLATSAAVGGATLRGFGLDAKETGRVTDVMAKSFSSSALDMQKFQDSMKYVAPVAKIAGFGIEGTTAMLGQLANAGIDGSMAGTALRKIFLELSNESSKLSKRLGGSVSSVDELIPALQKLNEEGISTAEMKDLVGQRAISAFSILLDGSGDVDTLAESFRNAGGSAQEMADIQLDTLEGKMTILKSATEGLGIAMADSLMPTAKSLVDTMTDLATSAGEFFTKMTETSLETAIREMRELGGATLEYQKIAEELSLINLKKQTLGLASQVELEIKQVFNNQEIVRLKEEELQIRAKLAKQGRSEEDLIAGIRAASTATLREYSRDELKAIRARAKDAKVQLDGLNTIKEKGEILTSENEIYATQIKQWKELELSKDAVLQIERMINTERTKEQESSLIQFEEAQGPFLPPDLTPESLEATEEQRTQALEMLQQYQFATLDIKEEAAIQELKSINATKEQILAVEKFYDQQRIKSALNTTGKLLGAMGQLNSASKGSALVTARLQQGAVVANTASAAMAAITPPTGAPTPLGYANMAAVIITGLAQGVQIEQGLKQIKGAATGMDEIVSSPTLIMAGEGGRAEHIGITPLEGPNIDGPQGGSSITVNVSGNVLSQDFVEGELAENIKEAIRRGTDFGIS